MYLLPQRDRLAAWLFDFGGIVLGSLSLVRQSRMLRLVL